LWSLFLFSSQVIEKVIQLYYAVAGIPCGKQFDRVPKIVGGIPTFQNEYPWVVSLKRHGKHFCSGVIVHSRFVLTAAQCVTFKKFVSLDYICIQC